MKVGDRVKVYGNMENGNKYLRGEKGTILESPFKFTGEVRIRLDYRGIVVLVHEKQCRKIKKSFKQIKIDMRASIADARVALSAAELMYIKKLHLLIDAEMALDELHKEKKEKQKNAKG